MAFVPTPCPSRGVDRLTFVRRDKARRPRAGPCVGLAPGRLRDPALRALRPVRREPAGRPICSAYRLASAARGHKARGPPLASRRRQRSAGGRACPRQRHAHAASWRGTSIRCAVRRSAPPRMRGDTDPQGRAHSAAAMEALGASASGSGRPSHRKEQETGYAGIVSAPRRMGGLSPAG